VGVEASDVQDDVSGVQQVLAVAVGQAGDREVIVPGGWEETVRVWDAVTGQLLAQQQFPDAIWSLALADQRLAVAQRDDVALLRVNPRVLRSTGLSASQGNVP
jgi:hypothetical protein